MKKSIILLMTLLALALTACGATETKESPAQKNVESTTEAKNTDQTNTETTTEAEKLFDGKDYTDIGSGTVHLVNASGSTENGDHILIYVTEDPYNMMESIELDAWEFDGSLLSYIYIDGKLNDKEQLADSQITLGLTGDELLAGDHKVEVVQYQDNDDTKEVVTYKTQSYEVKN